MSTTLFDFIGGDSGQWQVTDLKPVTGEPLARVSHVQVRPASALNATAGQWALQGVVSNLRYTEKREKEALVAIQAGLDRPEATCAALIPMRKSAAWWALAQDERRAIFENQSHHTQTGLAFLPAIARKLYHCRDLGGAFDFLTWLNLPRPMPRLSTSWSAPSARPRNGRTWTAKWTFA